MSKGVRHGHRRDRTSVTPADPKGDEANCECVHLHAFKTDAEPRVGLTRGMGRCKTDRPHSGLAGQTSDDAYSTNEM